MGITTDTTTFNKRKYLHYLEATAHPGSAQSKNAVLEFFQSDADINVTQPINKVDGRDAYLSTVVEPLCKAFRHLSRRTDILLGGEYNGAEWVVSHGHFVGEFVSDWMGIPANNKVVWLHTIEYHRLEDGQSVETYLYFDMLDLLRQIDRMPIRKSLGFEGFVPGPASGDGVLLDAQNPDVSSASLKMVDDMLAELWTPEEKWRSAWHDDMLWYGPSGYGSQIGLDGFEKFQHPYEAMFAPGSFSGQMKRSGIAALDDRVSGHFARFGDGNYVASGGWPSHGGIMGSDWLGIPANDQPFTVRVADVWRRRDDLLIENWVFVDIVDMALQLGRDLFADAGISIRLDSRVD